MNPRKIPRMLALAILIGASSIITGLAGNWYYSDVIMVSVKGYGITIVADPDLDLYQNITFSGYVTRDSSPVEGATVYVFRTTSDGSILETLESTTSQTDGYYSVQWNATVQDDLYFKAGFQSPHWYYSDVVMVSVKGYEVTIEAPTEVDLYQDITFSGYVTRDSSPVEGATVYVFRTTSDGSILETLGSTTSQADGYYSMQWTATVQDDLYFKAGFQSP